MKIAIASANEGKIKEFKEILEPLGYEIISASNLGVDMGKVKETGTTFAENAKLKSDYLFKKTNITSIADDSGLVIRALPEILGVASARFMGEETSYEIKNKRILEMLANKEDRYAYFESAISYTSKDEHKIFTGRVYGVISRGIMGHKGFGYDPIFIPEGFDSTFGMLDDAQKNQISHRACALKKFKEYVHEK